MIYCIIAMEKNNLKVRVPRLHVQFYCQLPGWLRANCSGSLNLFAKLNIESLTFFLFLLLYISSSSFLGVRGFLFFLKTYSGSTVNHNLIMNISNQLLLLNIQINDNSTCVCWFATFS